MTNIEIEKVHAEIGKLMAETLKLQVEAAKITAESRWYPVVATAGIFGAALAVFKLVF